MQQQKPQTTEKSLKSDQKTMQNLIREDIALEKSVLRVTTENKKLMNEIAILNRKDDKYGNLDIGVFITGGLLFLTAASISLISFLSRW